MRGWFVVQGRVAAVRFNGKTLSGVQLGDRKTGDAVAFIVQGRLIQNINTLEIDVDDTMPPFSQGNALMVVPTSRQRDSASRPGTPVARRPAARRGAAANPMRQ